MDIRDRARSARRVVRLLRWRPVRFNPSSLVEPRREIHFRRRCRSGVIFAPGCPTSRAFFQARRGSSVAQNPTFETEKQVRLKWRPLSSQMGRAIPPVLPRILLILIPLET